MEQMQMNMPDIYDAALYLRFRSLIYMWMTDTQEEILTDLSLNE